MPHRQHAAVPLRPAGVVPVIAALDERARLWVHVECLPWLVQYIQAEKQTGGVPPVEEPEENQPPVQWNFQHNSWQALATAPDGKKQRRERCVKAQAKSSQYFFAAGQGSSLPRDVGMVGAGGSGPAHRQL